MKKFTKKSLKELKNMEGFNDRLSKRVINDLLNTRLSTEELKNHITDIINYRCVSGCVSSLIYYSDTVRFFNCYKKEIKRLIYDTENSHEDIRGKYAIIYDTVIYENQKKLTIEEKNIFAWFAYEEIVRRIAQDYFKL